MSDEHATQAWIVGDHPLAPMPPSFVAAVDALIAAQRDVQRKEYELRWAKQRESRSREHMHEVMPPEIDNAKVGFRLPDVFAWRRG